MNRPLHKLLSRRGFLGAMAAAPVAVKGGAIKALMAKVEDTAAFTATGVRVAMPGGGMHGLYRLINNPTLLALHKAGMLPDWMRHEIETDAASWNGGVVLPDIGALRSVSLGAKLRMSREAMIAQAFAAIDKMHAIEMARQAFMGPDVGAPKPAGDWS